jgi:hypothetical protein
MWLRSGAFSKWPTRPFNGKDFLAARLTRWATTNMNLAMCSLGLRYKYIQSFLTLFSFFLYFTRALKTITPTKSACKWCMDFARLFLTYQISAQQCLACCVKTTLSEWSCMTSSFRILVHPKMRSLRLTFCIKRSKKTRMCICCWQFGWNPPNLKYSL